MKTLAGNRKQQPSTEKYIVRLLAEHYKLKPWQWDGNRLHLITELRALGFYDMCEHEKRKLQELAKT